MDKFSVSVPFPKWLQLTMVAVVWFAWVTGTALLAQWLHMAVCPHVWWLAPIRHLVPSLPYTIQAMLATVMAVVAGVLITDPE